MSDRKTTILQSVLISAALVALILIAFEPVRHNGFVDYDDNQYLTENIHIQSGFSLESVKWAFTSGYASNWHPLTWLSHMLDVELFGLNPLGHHIHNVVLHAIATILLFFLLKRMTGALWCSAFAAMAFGIHPLRVESVAWVSERKDVLSAVFWMLTILAYVKYVEAKSAVKSAKGALPLHLTPGTSHLTPSSSRTWYVIVLILFAFGLMAKPMLVSLPIVLLILDFWPLKRVSGAGCQVSGEDALVCTSPVSFLTLIFEKVPLLALALASSLITYLVQQHGQSVAFDLPLKLRIANALTSYVAYLGNILWPHHFGALLYPYPTEWPLWKPLAAALILLAGSFLALRKISRQPHLAAGWFWFGITLIPVIGLVQVGSQSMADRYSYIPSIGIFIIIAWAIARLSVKWPYRKTILATLSGILALGMIVQTRTQTRCWKDSITLFEHALAITRDNYRMHYNLGWTLARQGRADEAIAQFNHALRLRPDYPDANLDLADLLIKRGELDQALVHLDRVLKAEPANALAHYNKGVVFQSHGKLDDAMDEYAQAVRSDPNNAKALNNLGILKTGKGLLYEAADCFRQSLQANPDKAETHRNFAAVLQMQNRFEDAIVHYRIALKKNPGDFQTSWDLAYALHVAGNLAEAAEYDRYTLRLKPDHTQALNDLAWILATTPDGKTQNHTEAISLAQKALALSESNEPDILDTLATAYASASQFKEAVETAQKAITLAKAAGQEDLGRQIEKRLQLFQAEIPYFECPQSIEANN